MRELNSLLQIYRTDGCTRLCICIYAKLVHESANYASDVFCKAFVLHTSTRMLPLLAWNCIHWQKRLCQYPEDGDASICTCLLSKPGTI